MAVPPAGGHHDPCGTQSSTRSSGSPSAPTQRVQEEDMGVPAICSQLHQYVPVLAVQTPGATNHVSASIESAVSQSAGTNRGHNSAHLMSLVWKVVLKNRKHLKTNDIHAVCSRFREKCGCEDELSNQILTPGELAHVLALNGTEAELAHLFDELAHASAAFHQGTLLCDMRLLLVAMAGLTKANLTERMHFALLLLDVEGTGQLSLQHVMLILQANSLLRKHRPLPEREELEKRAQMIIDRIMGSNTCESEDILPDLSHDMFLHFVRTSPQRALLAWEHDVLEPQSGWDTQPCTPGSVGSQISGLAVPESSHLQVSPLHHQQNQGIDPRVVIENIRPACSSSSLLQGSRPINSESWSKTFANPNSSGSSSITMPHDMSTPVQEPSRRAIIISDPLTDTTRDDIRNQRDASKSVDLVHHKKQELQMTIPALGKPQRNRCAEVSILGNTTDSRLSAVEPPKAHLLVPRLNLQKVCRNAQVDGLLLEATTKSRRVCLLKTHPQASMSGRSTSTETNVPAEQGPKTKEEINMSGSPVHDVTHMASLSDEAAVKEVDSIDLEFQSDATWFREPFQQGMTNWSYKLYTAYQQRNILVTLCTFSSPMGNHWKLLLTGLIFLHLGIFEFGFEAIQIVSSTPNKRMSGAATMTREARILFGIFACLAGFTTLCYLGGLRHGVIPSARTRPEGHRKEDLTGATVTAAPKQRYNNSLAGEVPKTSAAKVEATQENRNRNKSASKKPVWSGGTNLQNSETKSRLANHRFLMEVSATSSQTSRAWRAMHGRSIGKFHTAIHAPSGRRQSRPRPT